MTRIAHYVSSTHWDREWYDSFQGYRMRLVSLLDEVIDTLGHDEAFRAFVMDGQIIPVLDYLEIRPERNRDISAFLAGGRLRIGPWYVLPDEWLVSGESIIRNLQYGMALAREMGADPSSAGFACDMFGHIGQLPQIFDQIGIRGALVWRGLNEREYGGLFNWKSPDGTVMPSYRFGKTGYCTYAIEVRNARDIDVVFDFDETVKHLMRFTIEQSKRTPAGPILLFDGGDHLEIEPATSRLIAAANERLHESGIGIEIVHSDLDAYVGELADSRRHIAKTVVGELRETGRDPVTEDDQWLIPGVLSSRIRLKQSNARCEDELLRWAEPFGSFAAELGVEYPAGYLRAAWKHLLENHPHDSICGCSLDQVHKDMEYRFDQSLGISSRLTAGALKTISMKASPKPANGAIVLAVFNPTGTALDEPVDLELPLPADWTVFREFFGYEDKFSFRLRNASGDEIPYQLVSQRRGHMGFRRKRAKFPVPDERHVVTVTARLTVPAYGYTTLTVERCEGPIRHLGRMTESHRSIGNEYFTVTAGPNGSIDILDKRSGRLYKGLLTFEERADIGDGWYHGLAVNDIINTSAASSADVSVVADGIGKAALRISVTMNVPKHFDFHTMERSAETTPLVIVSLVTLRRGTDRVEVETSIENTADDHRVRVFLPTGVGVEGRCLCDSAFDVVERPVQIAPDNDIRRELDVETRPHVTWTACGDGRTGLAVVSRGLPECAVTDTPERELALTLFRGFRRAPLANDNPGGQVRGAHSFKYWIVPIAGEIPVGRLFLMGQRVNLSGGVRTAALLPDDYDAGETTPVLPAEHSFLAVEGDAVVTSVRREGDVLTVRLFNTRETTTTVRLIRPSAVAGAECVLLDGRRDYSTTVVSVTGGTVELLVPPKRIATLHLA